MRFCVTFTIPKLIEVDVAAMKWAINALLFALSARDIDWEQWKP